MKAQERKNLKRENARELILSAAKRLFAKEGYQNTSIRKIATEINVSPTTIYLYYKDKNEITHALHQAGFQLLGSQLSPFAMVEHPFERLKAIGKSYIRFSFEHPDYYHLMFTMVEPLAFIEATNESHNWEEGNRVFSLLEATMVECQTLGYFKGVDIHLLALQAWALVHGLCALNNSTHLQKAVLNNKIEVNVETIVEDTFLTFIRFIEQTKSN